MTERSITVDGLATRVLEDGDGPAVLLLHGGAPGCSADDWTAMLAPLAAAGFHALTLDQPGFGTCSDPAEVSLVFRMRYILGALDTLGIERATWVGHSQAGRLVFSGALRSPERVAAGVVMCTGSLLPPLRAGGGVEPVAAPREPTVAETRAYLESAVYDRTRISDALVDIYLRFGSRNLASAVRRAADPAADESPPAWQRLAEPKPPLTFVYGANDRGSVPERIALARERYPKLPFHLLERCGHFAMWDHPETVAHLIAAAAKP